MVEFTRLGKRLFDVIQEEVFNNPGPTDASPGNIVEQPSAKRQRRGRGEKDLENDIHPPSYVPAHISYPIRARPLS